MKIQLELVTIWKGEKRPTYRVVAKFPGGAEIECRGCRTVKSALTALADGMMDEKCGLFEDGEILAQ